MFETLYSCTRTVARHANGPAAVSRLSYLEHLVAGGATVHSLRQNAGVMYRAAVFMGLDDSSPVERTAIEKAAKDWANRQYPNAMSIGPENSEKEFRSVTCCWLRFVGRLRDSNLPPVPHQAELDHYCRYLLEERGLSNATVVSTRDQLIKFFRGLGGRSLKKFQIQHVDEYLAKLGKKGWTRAGLSTFANRIRGFFRYGEQHKWTKPGISAAIRGPRVYRNEHLPLGPTWPDVQRLLASTETDRKYDIRDRAILLLLAVYGMRVGEVRRIRLSDLNWESNTLTIPRTKQRRERICPIIPSLAAAITRYIREVRPRQSAYQELFLRLAAPHQPFGHGGVYGIVRDRMRRLQIKAPRLGPHGLRHACATHLLAQGLTLTEIGGLLGHSSMDSTRVYAKVDMPALRDVAELDLGGLL
jgi:integrase/recombinase XerD